MTFIVAGAVIIGVVTAVFVLYPVFRASDVGRQYIPEDSTRSDRLADLLARRDAIYEAIRDADFDLETGKLTEEDHRVLRERLTAEGVRLLQELDRVMQSDVRDDLEQEIEREVAELRQSRPALEGSEREAEERVPGRPVSSPQPAEVDGSAATCPSCGDRVRAGAQFCTSCGASLALMCPECGVSVDPDDQFCRRCGAELSAEHEAAETAHAETID